MRRLLINTAYQKLLRWLALPLLFLALVAFHPQLQSNARTFKALPGEEVPTLDSPHIPYLGAPHQPYNSTPPTSGSHLPWTIATGVYNEEIPEELQIHALEHGHILIQYAPHTSKDQVQQLERIAYEHRRDVVLAPYAKLKSGVALTAWGRLELLDRVEADSVEVFVTALAGRYNHGWQR